MIKNILTIVLGSLIAPRARFLINVIITYDNHFGRTLVIASSMDVVYSSWLSTRRQ